MSLNVLPLSVCVSLNVLPLSVCVSLNVTTECVCVTQCVTTESVCVCERPSELSARGHHTSYNSPTLHHFGINRHLMIVCSMYVLRNVNGNCSAVMSRQYPPVLHWQGCWREPVLEVTTSSQYEH